MLRARRSLLATSLVVVAALASGCGGDDFERSEFVQQVTDRKGGLDRQLANCVYDRMSRDSALVEDLRVHGGWSDEISVESDAKMQRIMARCVLAQDESPAETTTTTSR